MQKKQQKTRLKNFQLNSLLLFQQNWQYLKSVLRENLNPINHLKEPFPYWVKIIKVFKAISLIFLKMFYGQYLVFELAPDQVDINVLIKAIPLICLLILFYQFLFLELVEELNLEIGSKLNKNYCTYQDISIDTTFNALAIEFEKMSQQQQFKF